MALLVGHFVQVGPGTLSSYYFPFVDSFPAADSSLQTLLFMRGLWFGADADFSSDDYDGPLFFLLSFSLSAFGVVWFFFFTPPPSISDITRDRNFYLSMSDVTPICTSSAYSSVLRGGTDSFSKPLSLISSPFCTPLPR